MAKGAILTKTNLDRINKFDWEIDGFAGLDNSSDPSALPEYMSPNNLNVTYDLTGAEETRKGYAKLLTQSVPGAIINDHPFYLSNGTKILVFAANCTNAATAPGGVPGTYLYKYDNAGGSVQIGGPFSLNTFWDFTIWNDVLYAVNGAEGMQSWVGRGSVVLANPIVLERIQTRKNRLYGSRGSILYFSDAGDPTSWPTNNYVQINTNDGQLCTSVKTYFDDLVIFKTQSVWYLQGEPLGAGLNTTIGNLQLRQADSDVGCPAPLSIRKIRRGVLMWVCESGVAVMQNYHVSIISQNIENTFKNDMNPNFINLIWGIYSPPEKKYIFGYPSAGSSTPDKAMLIDMTDPKTIKFAQWDHFPGSCACLFRFTYRDTVLIGHPTKGYIVEAFLGYADIAGDNGTATAAGTASVVTTNLVTNPSFETNTAGWTNAGGSGTILRTPGGVFGSWYLAAQNVGGSGAQTTVPVAGSTHYTISLYLQDVSHAGSGGGNVTIELADTATLLSTTVLPPVGGWQRYTFTVVTSPGATTLNLFVLPTGSGSTVNIDAVQIELGEVASAYFDGSFATSGDTAYAWTGAANGSSSTKTITNASLTDSTKAWTTNQFVDADVTIVAGTGAGQQLNILSNTGTQLLLNGTWGTTPDATSVYSIGAYTSYNDTRIEDFGHSAYDKKVKYYNIFSDAHSNQNLRFGYATAYQQLAFSDQKNTAGGGLTWEGPAGPDLWGTVGSKWGTKKQVFLRFEVGDTDKRFQARWGNNLALQPWRVSKYSVTFKFKKVRPDVV